VLPIGRRWVNLAAGLLIFAAGSVFGYWLTTFFGEPPLETPAPLEKLAEDTRDLLEGREGREEPESYPFPEGSEKERRKLEGEDLVQLYPNLVYRFGNREKKQVALTFDDGPDATFTPPILDILKKEGVKATFFLTGVRVEQFPEIARRIAAEGHGLASHGYYHKDYTTLTPKAIQEDLDKNNQVIARASEQIVNIFRPPYGALDSRSIEAIRAAGYKIVLWDVDSLDWMNLPREKVLENVLPEVQNGSIVLQHSAAGPGQDLTGTVEALPEIIAALKEKGYTFVTVHELLGISPPPRR